MIKVTVWNEFVEENMYEHVKRFTLMEFIPVLKVFWKQMMT